MFFKKICIKNPKTQEYVKSHINTNIKCCIFQDESQRICNSPIFFFNFQLISIYKHCILDKTSLRTQKKYLYKHHFDGALCQSDL